MDLDTVSSYWRDVSMVITNTRRRDSGGSEYAREINVNQHRQEGMRDCSDAIRNANDKVSNSGGRQKNKYLEIGGMEWRQNCGKNDTHPEVLVNNRVVM